jgi:small subunit ribosomal protein S5
VLEAAGVKDVLTKSLGSSNRVNMAKATILALKQLRDPQEAQAKRKPVSKAKVEEAASDG